MNLYARHTKIRIEPPQRTEGTEHIFFPVFPALPVVLLLNS